ncbi:hypothetical protein [Streptomyces sp. NPDC056105]
MSRRNLERTEHLRQIPPDTENLAASSSSPSEGLGHVVRSLEG